MGMSNSRSVGCGANRVYDRDAKEYPASRILCFREKPEGDFMNNLNSILIEGNLVRDPLLRSTPKGTPVCTFSLASNRYYKQDTHFEQEVSFFEVETWAKLAESCNTQGHKGRGVRVVGRLKQDRWTGTDGKSHSKIAIVADHVEFRPDFRKEAAAVAATGTTAQEPETATSTSRVDEAAAEAAIETIYAGQSPQTAEEMANGSYVDDGSYATEDYGSVIF
jgi:single-strand DNA-binding protein